MSKVNFDLLLSADGSLQELRVSIDFLIRELTVPFTLFLYGDNACSLVRRKIEEICHSPLGQRINAVLFPHNSKTRSSLKDAYDVGISPYVVFLESGTIVFPGFLARLQSIFSTQPDVGVISSISNVGQPDRVGDVYGKAFMGLPSLMVAYKDLVGKSDPIEMESANSPVFAVRRKVITLAEDANEITALGCCELASRAGMRAVVDPSVFAYTNRTRRLARTPAETSLFKASCSTFLDASRAKAIRNRCGSGSLDVCYLLPGAGLYGGVLSVFQLVNNLVLMGVHANVAVYGGLDKRVLDAYPLYFEPFIFSSAEELIDSLPSSKVLLATHWSSVTLALKLNELRPDTRLAYFVQDFEPDFYSDSESAFAQQAEQTYSLIGAKICKSSWLARRLKQYPGSVTQVPLGLNLDVFYPRYVRRRRQILAMARPSSRHRNFDLLRQVYAKLHKADPSLGLAVYGEGYNAAEFDCPINDYGTITKADLVAEALSESLILLDASLFQGFGRPGLEAMACATAAVLTRNGGITQYAKHRHNCLLVDPVDLQDCVQAVLSLAANEDERTGFVRNGLATVKRFSCELEAERTKAFLDSFALN